MIRWRSTLGLALALSLCAAHCFGGDPLAKRSWFSGWAPCRGPQTLGSCPDDYCRKPLPCIPCPPKCRTCDDYCRKPLPCLPSPAGCRTCDDYCRKPFPHFCWPASCDLVCVTSCGHCPRCQALKVAGDLSVPTEQPDENQRSSASQATLQR